jgi:ABC-type nitrate/sulfonate/bicarbonate transport system substrate-binding protein
VIVGGVFDKADYILMGAKGIKDLNGLRGKIIGTTGAGSFSEFAVVESLKRKAGLIRDKDYTILPVGGTAVRVAALQSGRIHAAPLSSGERVDLEAAGFPALMDVGKVIPEFPFLVVTATNDFAKSHPDKVVGFLRALDRATELIRKDRGKAVSLGKAHRLPGEPETQRKYLEHVADNFQLRLQKDNIDSLLKVLGINQAPEAFFDDSFLKRALNTTK